ncbi:MAG: BrnT family toxin [Acidobacteriota bacterium]
MKFDWDDKKALRNISKHDGVTFQEATTVFDDPYFVALTDDDHSFDELRYWIIGESIEGGILLVVYTERNNLTWIISARKATKQEREVYEEEKFKSF